MNAVLPPDRSPHPSRPEARTLAGRGPGCLPAWSPYPRRPQAGMPPA